MSFCIDLKFKKIGSGCEKINKSTVKIDTSIMSKNISETVMNSISEEETNVVTVQSQNVTIKGNCCNDLNIDQSLKLKMINTSSINVKMINTISNGIKTQYIEQLNKNADKIGGLIGREKAGQLITTIKNEIVNETSSTSLQSNIVKKLNQTFGSQGQNINIECAKYTDTPIEDENNSVCVITQEFLLEQTINNIIDIVIANLAVNEEINKVVNSIQSNVKEEEFPFIYPNWIKNNKLYLLLLCLIIFIPIIIRIIIR
jgi:hypothetical protein